LPKGSAALTFCKIPLALAIATLDCLKDDKEKLSRSDVVKLVATCLGEMKNQAIVTVNTA